jgi:hypothetical protein
VSPPPETVVVTRAFYEAYQALRSAAMDQPHPTRALREALGHAPRYTPPAAPWPPLHRFARLSDAR